MGNILIYKPQNDPQIGRNRIKGDLDDPCRASYQENIIKMDNCSRALVVSCACLRTG